MAVTYIIERITEYANYIEAHKNFEQTTILKKYLAKDMLGSVTDFNGVDYLTYDEIIRRIGLNPHAIQNLINEQIDKAQGLFDEVFHNKATQYSKSDSQQQAMAKLMMQINKLVQAAETILSLYDLCETTKKDGYVEHVYKVMQNIKTQVEIIKSSAQQQNSLLFNIGHVRKNQVEYDTVHISQVANFLYDGIGKNLGHMYESLISSRIGKMPYEIANSVVKTMKTNNKGTLRGAGIIKSSTKFNSFDFPESKYDIFKSTLEHNEGMGIVDYWIRGDVLGLEVDLPVSQKEYRQSSWTGTKIEIPGIESHIGEMVTGVAENSQQAYALYGAFASPLSRGTKPFKGGTLGSSVAEAILRHTIAETMVGSGDNIAKGFMLNRKLYTFYSIFQKIFDVQKDLNKTDIFRVKVAAKNGGIEQAQTGKNAKERYEKRAKSEELAAGIYMSKSRLEKIRASSFSTNWTFDSAWVFRGN